MNRTQLRSFFGGLLLFGVISLSLSLFNLAFDNPSTKVLPIFQNFITMGFFLMIVGISGLLSANKNDN